jgi:hypothetical protein
MPGRDLAADLAYLTEAVGGQPFLAIEATAHVAAGTKFDAIVRASLAGQARRRGRGGRRHRADALFDPRTGAAIRA